MMKSQFRFLLLLLTSLFLIAPQLPAQVTKTWSFSTSKKSKKGKSKMSPDEMARHCNGVTSESRALFRELNVIYKNMPYLIGKDGLDAGANSSLYRAFTAVDKNLLAAPSIPAKINLAITEAGKCRSAGQANLSGDALRGLQNFGGTVPSLVSGTLDGFEASVRRAETALHPAASAFADEVVAPQPEVARKEIKDTEAAFARVQRLANDYAESCVDLLPRLQTIAEGYEKCRQDLDQQQAEQYRSAYHASHFNTIVFSSTGILPTAEAQDLEQEFRPDAPLHAAILLENKTSSHVLSHSNRSFFLHIAIGEQEIFKSRISTGGYGKEVFLPFTLYAQDADANLSNGLLSEQNRRRLLQTLARLSPRSHELTFRFANTVRTVASGTLTLDCSGMASGAANPYSKLEAGMDAIQEADRRANWVKRMRYTQAMNNAALKKTIEQHLLDMGKGKVKRAKVFLNEARWTAVVNGKGTPLYRELDFHYLLEAADGTFFMGKNSLWQSPMYGGGFDTEDKKPSFSPLAKSSGTLKDLWEHNYHGVIYWQLRVDRETFAGHWD